MLRVALILVFGMGLALVGRAQLRPMLGYGVQFSAFGSLNDPEGDNFWLPGFDIRAGVGGMWKAPNDRFLLRADVQGEFAGSLVILLGLGYQGTAGVGYRLWGPEQAGWWLGLEHGYMQRRYALSRASKTHKFRGGGLWRLSLTKDKAGGLSGFHITLSQNPQFWMVAGGITTTVYDLLGASKRNQEATWYE